MHVLFVTSARFDKNPYGDGSTRYRCFNVGEALEAAGHTFSITSINTLSVEQLHLTNIVSVLRPRYTNKLSRFIKDAKNRGIHTVVDFDDLIFNPRKAIESPMVVNGFSNTENVTSTFQLHAKAAALFDEVTVSTPALLKEVNINFPDKNAYLLQNGLSNFWLNHSDHLLNAANNFAYNRSIYQRITYLPGTVGHDEDFRQVQDAVLDWLDGNNDRRFCIVGKLKLDKCWSNNIQLEMCPLVDYFLLPKWIDQSNVTIAPLVNNEFNYAKSHIKYLESAAFGVPAICSPNSDLETHIEAPSLKIERGLDSAIGLNIACTAAQWEHALNQVKDGLPDASLRKEVRADVRAKCHTTVYSESTIERWETITNSNKNRTQSMTTGAIVE